MKRVFIVDEHSSSKQNGIGTFVKELFEGLRPFARTNLISFNDDVKFYRKERVNDSWNYRIPVYCNGAFLNNAAIGVALLKNEIADNENNIFIVNHFPCIELLENLRQFFPLSKIVFVIHNQQWVSILQGDDDLFRKLVMSHHLTGEEEMLRNQLIACFHMEKRMYMLADAVVSLAADTTSLLKEVYAISQNKIFEIPNGKSIVIEATKNRSSLRKELLLDDNDKVLLFAGRTAKIKGIDIILKSFNEVVKQHPEARLVIAGQVFRLNEFATICPNGISRIIYTGLLPKGRLYNWYRVADIGLMCSYHEQCSYTGIEMLAFGLPIIASDAPCVRNMFHEDINAKVVSIGDHTNDTFFVKNLANTMCDILNMNDKEIALMRQKARKYFEERYVSNRMYNNYLNMLESL